MDIFTLNKYDKNGYNKDGFDRNGYNRNGYNKYGFDINGFDISGFDINGFNKDSIDIEGHKFGYKDGYNRDGYDKNGYDRNGYDKNGYNELGFDKNGINIYGFDKNGIDQKLRENAYQRAYPFGTMFEGNTVNKNMNSNFQEDIMKTLAEDDRKEYKARLELENDSNKEGDKCYIYYLNGVKILPPEYRKYGCNLYKYYNKCKDCVKKGDDYCLIYDTSSYCPSSHSLEECKSKYPNEWTNAGVNVFEMEKLLKQINLEQLNTLVLLILNV